jgi:uncharacterized protein DUF1905
MCDRHTSAIRTEAAIATLHATFRLMAVRVVVPSEPMELQFTGEIIHWRGPAPFHFVLVPDEESAAIELVSSLVTYGWGVIPVRARIGSTEFRTSLFPRDGQYLVPIKVAVRNAQRLSLGDVVTVHLTLDV